MLNKKDFLKYASKLAFPIMIQNLIGTLVNVADTVMLGYVSQTAMSASSLANQYTFILFCLYYGMATGTSVLCAQYWGKGDKKTVEKILGLAERISLIVSLVFFVISFSMPTTIMKIFTNSPDTIAAGRKSISAVRNRCSRNPPDRKSRRRRLYLPRYICRSRQYRYKPNRRIVR